LIIHEHFIDASWCHVGSRGQEPAGGPARFPEKIRSGTKEAHMKHPKITGNRNVPYARAATLLGAGLSLLISVQALAQTPPPGGDGDDAGQVAFNTHCRNCHSVKPDDHRLGPSLHGIFGAPAGQAKGFANYSGGLTADIKWDEATLDKFITDPKSIASNTTMTPFGGVQEPEQRKLIIEYLKAESAAKP
jgi:cytochrome c